MRGGLDTASILWRVAAPAAKVAPTELWRKFRYAAVGGVMPGRAFAEHAQTLGHGGADRDRLRGELPRLGLPGQRLGHVHTEADSPDVIKVARTREENVFVRLSSV